MFCAQNVDGSNNIIKIETWIIIENVFGILLGNTLNFNSLDLIQGFGS